MKKYKLLFFILLLISFIYSLSAKNFYSREGVRIYPKKTAEDNGYIIYAENRNVIPCNVGHIKIDDENLKLSIDDMPKYFVIPPKTKDFELFRLIRKREGEEYSFDFEKIEIGFGDPGKLEPDENYIYTFPYEHGKKYQVHQGFNGTGTHHGSLNEYAIDFAMPIGTPICAARDGIVFRAIDFHRMSDEAFTKRFDQNEIFIYHDDGTIGAYVHLHRDSIVVKEGDRVNVGDFIALSGDSKGGPHLHFSIFVPHRDEIRTIHFYMRDHDGSPVTIKNSKKEGQYYYSVHPDKPEFKMILGINLRNEDYEGYSKEIKGTGQVKVRYEKIDNTYIAFIQNGKPYKCRVRVDFHEINLRTSKDIPFKINVPAKTEVYGLLFQIKEFGAPFGFNPDITYEKKD